MLEYVSRAEELKKGFKKSCKLSRTASDEKPASNLGKNIKYYLFILFYTHFRVNIMITFSNINDDNCLAFDNFCYNQTQNRAEN